MRAVTKTLLACFLLLFMVAGATQAQEEMTMDEYKAQLQEWTSREAAAKTELTACDEGNASLQSQIDDVDGQIDEVWSEIYSTIGTTEEEVNAFRDQLNQLENELNALGALSPEELFKRRKELDDIEARLGEMKKNRIAVLTEMRDKIAALEGKIAQLRANMPKGMYDEYTVMRGDYLWKISKKPDIYGDPFQWIRIYSYNRDQINNPDLIYPDQIFKIHRENGPDEYMVSQGDNLAKIAGSMDVMGDPTKWRQLYEANQGVIGDEPSLIYPHQVLKIPRE